MREHLDYTLKISWKSSDDIEKTIQSIAVQAACDVANGSACQPSIVGKTPGQCDLIQRSFDAGQLAAISNWSQDKPAHVKGQAKEYEAAYEYGSSI
jgi:hypothetical protein